LWVSPPAMKNSMGIDSARFARDVSNATRLALFFSSSEEGVRPRTYFWFGQISNQTLTSMIVPSQAPVPIPA